jgi:Collagen triple helix repeat (20 copies)
MSTFLEKLKKHLSYANVAATMALVFALTGGAVAASSHGGGGSGSGSPSKASVASAHYTAAAAKKKSKAPARGPAGPKGATGATGATGAAGATGPAGAPGAKGENGAAGINGINGTNGEKGETGPQGPPGNEGEPGAIHPGNPVGSAEPLPAEATETGSWSFGRYPAEVATGEFLYTALSFPIPLKAALASTNVHYIDIAGQELPAGVAPTECGTPAGTAEDPKASPGNLCVYEARSGGGGMTFQFIEKSGSEAEGASTAGAILVMKGGAESFAWGTWAVTEAG